MHKLDRHFSFPFSHFLSLLASACDEAKIIIWRQGSERVVCQGRGKRRFALCLGCHQCHQTPESPFPLQLTAPSHTSLYICVGLNQCVNKPHQGLASSYRCKIFHLTPRVTQGGHSRASLGSHLHWGRLGSHPILLPAPKQPGWNLLLINTLCTRTRRSRRGCWILRVGRKIQQ